MAGCLATVIQRQRKWPYNCSGGHCRLQSLVPAYVKREWWVFPWSNWKMNISQSTSCHRESLTDGYFKASEIVEARVVPFIVDDSSLNRTCALVDGIYPKYSGFGRGLKWMEIATKITVCSEEFLQLQERELLPHRKGCSNGTMTGLEHATKVDVQPIRAEKSRNKSRSHIFCPIHVISSGIRISLWNVYV